MLGQPVRWENPIVKGFVGCWLMNEGSGEKTYDLSGNGYTGTFVNSPIWTAGNHGPAINFVAASTQHITTTPPVTTYPYTLLAWFKAVNTTANHSLITLYQSGSNWSSLAAWGARAGDPVGASSRGTTTQYEPETTVGYTANKWHQAVGVYVSSTERHVYLDGGNKVTGTAASTPAAFTTNYIGQGGAFNYMDGDIGVAMIWNRALTDSEVAQLYRDPFCMFRPSWNWTLYGAIVIPTGVGQVIFINMN